MKSILIVTAALVLLNSCGGKKEWEIKADEYCDCIKNAKAIKESDSAGYLARFRECQDLTTKHQQEITDKNDVFDYRKKINACIDELYK